ncbi:2-dehydro-3-deoxy-D-gluconate 5-dehydrogenase KduD [Halocella sp. SP3-1]|uniref:2-dehydro-3-deoxy-D-gluconate 5-dehydrogenase KduD n=1 Tax=Halocella sp. SP3-1 TaxID=2382161 RepID=UPI000F74E593|nr:2-dehydro-3-deoxy-D-gluconate 5-dehydrogenase KduD [Halocella sp. SP3-1]AZO93782.1 2-dehydro-3-deoxy-D-gluconate 5-dehydrogenase KduD [Halocella sp. SP3-1]
MILNDFKLDGKVALVTGCSRPNGLGFGMVEALAEAGADIVGVGPSDMSATKKQIESIGKSFLEVNADLKSTDAIDEIVNKTLDVFGKIDILVNNSGTIRRNEIIDFSEKDWDDVMNINLKSLFFLSQKVAKVFIDKDEGGKIINIASMLSFQGGLFVPSYTASKHGVAGITKSMANEWAKYNINVNAIAPGYMATDNTAPLREDKERSQSILARIPAGRWGTNDDLKGLVVFLASPASAYINGYVIAVDGGWLAS